MIHEKNYPVDDDINFDEYSRLDGEGKEKAPSKAKGMTRKPSVKKISKKRTIVR